MSQQPQHIPVRENVSYGSVPPTGWQSIPHAVRFAVWLWAIAVIFSFVAGVITGLVLLVGWAAS